MNCRIALDILDLPNKNYTKNELKKAYYKKCLQYHPDKTKSNDSDMFKKSTEAYNYLKERNNITSFDDCSNLSYSDTIKNYISLISEKYGWDNDIINNIFDLILKDATKISFKIFEKMKYDILIEIYEYILKFQYLFGIEQTNIDKLREIIKAKYKNPILINLKPTLLELMNDQIYVLEEGDKTKYIPLWHNELHYKNCIVHINPILPDHIDIDEHNNLNIFINMTETEMFNGEKKEIEICDDHSITIDTNNLYCRKFQKYIIRDVGIARINETNIYDVNERGDIIFHINKV